jgi:SAM-dependent methyltransferase
MTSQPSIELDAIRNAVEQRYAQAASLALTSAHTSCCSGTASCCDPITTGLYGEQDAAAIPEEALQASLGCGNPTALAELSPGEVVLDLGSGGGIDVLLSARRVGPEGFAYGLDMTDEMLELAERHRVKSGLTNVRFLKGHIEDIPLPDNSVDVILSNCVINLSGDKDQVLREAYRVLRPGGRLAVSDIVWRRPIPDSIRHSADLWAGCIAGALLETEYIEKLTEAGFDQVSITPTRVYSLADMASMTATGSPDLDTVCESLDGAMISAFIRARKPTP